MSRYYAAASGGGGGSATFQDTFARADANPMSTTASDGNSWSINLSGGYDNPQILGNRAAGVAGGLGVAKARVATPTFAANQRATMTIRSTADIFIGVRCSASGDDSYEAQLVNSTTVTIYKVSGGSPSAMGANFTITAVASGDTIGLEATGTSTTTITLYRNGVSQGTRTDSTSPHTSGQPCMVFIANGVEIEQVDATDV